jgi:predicted Zn-dependent protease
MRYCCALFGLFLTLASALGRTPGEPLKPGFNLFSKEQDVQLGSEAAQQVRQKYKVVNDQFLQDYIRRVGDRLAATPEARESGFSFSFTVVVDPSVNAFALPGGPMFINTGLFRAVDNEAQLAGVMAHEMSHVILRHGTHEATKSKSVEILAALAQAAVGNRSNLSQFASGAINLGANSLLLHYSRDAESEADALGAHLMSEAGWDPMQLAAFFDHLNRTGPQRAPQFLSDHPNPGNREQAIEAEVKTIPRRQYGFAAGDFARARQQAAANK